MIPILFDSYAKTFATNGIGRLTDCVSCEVTEERNGIFELEMQYPITGVHYADIAEGNIIVTDHDEQKDKQPFVIYRISRPISGIVTVNAHHVSYDAANVIISPLTATSVTDAFASISANALTENPFTLWTDKTSSGTFAVKVPSPLKAILGGQKGSILDAFGGGEYKWDGYTIRLYAHRGRDNGVTIRYGKNLTNVVAERDTMGLYNAVIPYWSDGKETVVYGGIVTGSGGIQQKSYWTDERGVTITDENGVPFEFVYYIRQVTSMDLSQEFDEQPTVAELEARALQILNSNQPWIPKDNIKVDFVALWQTEEYKDIAPLERVRLCDTVSIYYPELGVDAKSKVIKVVWDCLAERYSSIELGTAKTSFADVITAETEEKLADVPNLSMMEQAISDATALITGGMGGHIVFLYDADGKPTDMLVMDTEDVTTAVHVLRINVNGIGFSSTGVSGPYRSAWTLDGKFVADFITAGTMSANRIKGGTLTLGGASNGNGVISVYDASGNLIGKWDRTGLTVTQGDINGGLIKAGKIISANGNAFFDLDNNTLQCTQIRGPYTTTSGGVDAGNLYIDITRLSQSSGYLGAARFYNSKVTGGELYICPADASGSKAYIRGGTGTNQLQVEIGDSVVNVNSAYIDGSTKALSGAAYPPSFYMSSGGFIMHYMGLSVQQGNFSVTGGTKSRIVETSNYGNRLLYCYETPSPLFGDVGEGVIAEDGMCYIPIEGIFAETVTLTQYQVFIQLYGDGAAFVKERTPAYFVIQGTPGLSFGWEIKAKQADFDQLRLDKEMDTEIQSQADYGKLAAEYVAGLKEGRIAA